MGDEEGTFLEELMTHLCQVNHALVVTVIRSPTVGFVLLPKIIKSLTG